jgi:branched-chain amino acid transport system permease protein
MPDAVAAPATRVRSRQGYLSFVAIAVLTAAMALVPLFGSSSLLRFMTELFMLIALAVAWNLIGGLAGYVSFGHAAFFGLGAYTAGYLLAHEVVPFPVAIAGAGLLAGLFAFAIGRPILRLRGHYFAIVTLGVAEALRQIASVLNPITGGGTGLSVPSLGAASRMVFYYSMLGLLVVSVVITAFVLRHRLGYALRAIKASEDAAATLGVNTTRSKVIAFVISAAIFGVAGGLYGPWILYIDPPTTFSIDLSVQPVVLAVVGGVGTLWGPVVGGVVVLVLGEAIWGSFAELHTAFLGIVLVFMVIVLPQGLLSLLRLRGGRRGGLDAILASIRKYSV